MYQPKTKEIATKKIDSLLRSSPGLKVARFHVLPKVCCQNVKLLTTTQQNILLKIAIVKLSTQVVILPRSKQCVFIQCLSVIFAPGCSTSSLCIKLCFIEIHLFMWKDYWL